MPSSSGTHQGGSRYSQKKIEMVTEEHIDPDPTVEAYDAELKQIQPAES